ncbi:MAG: HD domain-containing protein [Dehalococcoidales bacterium]|nr:HD domain-containing protein [Dehalococcoidales bacterium]
MSGQIPEDVLKVLKETAVFLERRRIEAWLVGGLVRDLLLGRPTADIDIVIDADAVATAREMADVLGGRFVPLDENHGIARVVVLQNSTIATKGQWNIDLSGLNGDIGCDLAGRDFSIDAMAVSLKKMIESPADCEIIDLFGGRGDLNNKVIKALPGNVFESDPARIMRAVRLAAELDFEIHPETISRILGSYSLIDRVAGERIHEELLRILASPRSGRFLRALDELKILTTLVPELEPSRETQQPAEHHWNVLDHSLETVRSLEFILRQGGWEYASPSILQDIPWNEELERHFAGEVSAGSRHSSLLKLAALLHDISKPETKIMAGRKIRFFGHSEQGAEIAAEVLRRLRFSNKEIGLVETMVRYHMRPTQMSHEGLPTRRAIYRYFRDTGPAGIDILYLSLADHLAARGPGLDYGQWKWHIDQVRSILEVYFQQPAPAAPVKLLDGHDLIALYGLKPGRELGCILESVREAQAAGEIFSREQALSYVKNRLLYREQK